MKKIAIFNYDLQIGGIQKSLINLLNNIDINNYEIDLYLFETENHHQYKNIIPDNINIIYLKPPRFKKVLNCLPFNFVKHLNINIKDKNYDYAIDFDTYQSVCSVACLKCHAKKRIMWIHNDIEKKIKYEFKYRIYHFFMKGKYRYYDIFVGVSKGVIEPFKRINKIKGSAKMIVIPNYIDTYEILNKSNIKSDVVINDLKYNLVTVGRLTYQKGIDILLKEFKKVINTSPMYHLYIIGDGKCMKKLTYLTKKLRIDSNVTFLGSKSNPYNIMKQMDGFVLTSRYEGQGMVILEAKALGLDIYIPNHLTRYVDDINGVNDITKAILKGKKKQHHFDALVDYNQKIINALNDLFRK